MLERVYLGAEPAAHLICRGFEKPLRSARILDPNFFRNGGESLDTPLWWSLYLDSIRKSPQNTADPPELIAVRFPRPLPVSSGSRKRLRECLPHYDAGTKVRSENTNRVRLLTHSAINSQTASLRQGLESVEAYRDENVKAEREILEAAENDETEAGEGDTQLSQSSADLSDTGFHKMLQVAQPTADQYDVTWKHFNLLSNQAPYAVDMFLFLSKSSDRRDLSRLVSVFYRMPRAYQNENFFRIAVNAALKSFQHKQAIDLAFMGARAGAKLIPSVIAHFVKNLLWASAAEVWRRNEIERYDPRLRLQYGSEGVPAVLHVRELLSECSSMIDLPTKVAALAERLKQDDPVYASHKITLKRLCRQLAMSAVLSEQIMRSITGKGLLTMLDLKDDLDVQNIHDDALRTILHMPEPGAKAQHALLVFRNLCFRAPRYQIHPSVFGTMISICGNAHYPSTVFDEILKAFSFHHGKPDEKAYQKAMTSCARRGDSQAVQKYLKAYVSDHGLPKNVGVMHPAIYVYASHGDAVNARKEFDRIETEFSLTPDVQCWNTLMLAHARSTDAFSAFKVYEEMLQNGVTANEYTYGTLISLCALHGDIESTLEWMQKTQDAGMAISVPMVGSMVQAYIYNEEIAQAEDLAEAATKSHPHTPLTRIWNSILHFYAARSDSDSIHRIQQKMKSLGVKPDGMTYAALMAALVSLGRTKDATQILRTLHFSQTLNADVFHFCLLLQGFVQENDRAMATVIYHEMQERFPEMCKKAQRSMLRLQGLRDLNAESPTRSSGGSGLEFPHQHSLQFLAHILSQLSPSDSRFGVPDFRSRRPESRNDLLAQLFDTVLASMMREGSYIQAEALMEQFDILSKSLAVDGREVSKASRKLLTMKMELAVKRRDWEKVDNVWEEIFSDILRRGVPAKQLQPTKTKSQLGSEDFNDRPPIPMNVDVFDTELTKHAPMIAEGWNQLDDESRVLPVHRLRLGRPLSTYIYALDLQFRHDDIIHLIEKRVPRSGFALDGVNWNTYVQVLSKSPQSEHRIRAFKVFEERMLDLTPHWNLLRRGKWMKSDFSKTTGNAGLRSKQSSTTPMTIREARKADPSLPVPTYFTMVYLATALVKAHRSDSQGDDKELLELEKYAKGTVRSVQAIPFLKDRIQGVLLRGREVTGDSERRPRSERSIIKRTDIGGVMGSKSPLDNIPREYLEDIERILAPRDDIRSLLKGEESKKASLGNVGDIQFAEKIDGQISLTPNVLSGKGRLESADEASLRIQKEEEEKFKIIEAIRNDVGRRHLVRDQYRGEPALEMLERAKIDQDPSPKPDTAKNSDWLYGTDSRLKTSRKRRLLSEISKPESIAQPSMDTSILTRYVTPRMMSKGTLFVERYENTRMRRAFARSKSKRAAIARERREKLKKRDRQIAEQRAAAKKREEEGLQTPDLDEEQETSNPIMPF